MVRRVFVLVGWFVFVLLAVLVREISGDEVEDWVSDNVGVGVVDGSSVIVTVIVASSESVGVGRRDTVRELLLLLVHVGDRVEVIVLVRDLLWDALGVAGEVRRDELCVPLMDSDVNGVTLFDLVGEFVEDAAEVFGVGVGVCDDEDVGEMVELVVLCRVAEKKDEDKLIDVTFVDE